MRKIVEYRKLLGADKDIKLNELKTLYRNFMKEYHPDKFQDENENKAAAEEKSKQIIEAYHTLVSVAPETHESNLEEYTKTISISGIKDFEYKAKRLRVDFADGSAYEYFDVPRNIYGKLVNSDTRDRFCRRHIYHSYVYRKASKAVEA